MCKTNDSKWMHGNFVPNLSEFDRQSKRSLVYQSNYYNRDTVR